MHTHHQSKITRQVFLLALGLMLCGCANTQKVEEEKPKPNAPTLVGRIASIPPERTFVLIQSYGPWDTPTGSILTTRGLENRTANLIFTGEKLGQFAAADIQSGTVEKGDAVYSRHTPKPPSLSFPITPGSDAPMDPEPLPDPPSESPLIPDLPE